MTVNFTALTLSVPSEKARWSTSICLVILPRWSETWCCGLQLQLKHKRGFNETARRLDNCVKSNLPGFASVEQRERRVL